MIRILIASPGDVKEERAVVREVVSELAERYRLPIDLYAWDDGTRIYDSAADAQEQIPEPETFDLVICLFATRLGTPLREADTEARDYWVDGAPPTGTQYEYLRASRLHQRRPDQPKVWKPFVPLYALAPREALARLAIDPGTDLPTSEASAQHTAARKFLKGREGLGPNRVFAYYTDKADLRGRVRDDFMAFLKLIEQLPATWTEGNPYAGLAPMDEDRSAVFVGREEEIDQGITAIVQALDEAATVPAFLLLTGPSGVGKSSLARAGLAARFNDKRRGARRWRRLVIRPAELGPNPAVELPRRLADPAAGNVPALGGRTLDLGAEAGTATAGIATTELRHALDAIEPGANLLLVVDQLEEALLSGEAGRYAPLFRAIDLLARSGRSVVLATLAGNHRDELARHPLLAALQHPHRTIALSEPDEPHLRRLIREPMERAGGTVDEGFVQRLLADRRSLADNGRGALPLLELALSQAYEAAASRGAAIGSGPAILEGDFAGLDHTVETLGAAALSDFPLAGEVLTLALWRLFRRLVVIDAQLGEVARPVRADALPADLRALADHLLARRLLVGDGAGYALPHIELLKRWSQGRDWLAQERRLVSLRDRLWGDAVDWHATPDDDPAKRRKLDMSAAMLEEAERLRALWPSEDLGEPLRTFLDAAIPFVRANLEREQALTRSNDRLSALYLAARSEEARAEDPDLAAAIALEGLPKGDERPIVAEAGSALCRALAEDPLRGVLRGHEDPVWSAVFDRGGTRIVTASDDKTARLWDAATCVEIAVLRGHEDQLCSAAFDRGGTRIVTASADNTARLWDAATGAEIAVLHGHEDQLWSAAFDRGGTRIVTASSDKTARLWDAATGAEIAVLHGHEGSVLSAAFDRGGTRIVTASVDNTARLWDAATGAEIAVLRGHENLVRSAAFDRGGNRIVTASYDKTARLWDAATGAEIAVLRGHENLVRSAAFDRGGTRIVTASRDHTARTWKVVRSDMADLIALGHLTRFHALSDAQRRTLYLPVPARGEAGDAVVRAEAKMSEAAAPGRALAEVLLSLAQAAELFEAAGETARAQEAREKRAALAWSLPIADVAAVYRRLRLDS